VATTRRKKIAKLVEEPEKKSPAQDKQGVLSTLERMGQVRVLIFLCLVSFLAYSNSLGGEFVFDDTEQIVENQNLRSWDNIGRAFTTHVWAFRDQQGSTNAPPPLPYYRPLFTVMLTIEYHLFGLWPQGWHLVSLFLHILCASAVFFLISQMSGRSSVGLFVGLLFAVHPVHAESVSWVSGMTDPLFGVFFLTSFYLYLKSRSRSEGPGTDRRAFAWSVAMYVCAMFAKETALSLTILIFGYEFIDLQGRMLGRMIEAAKRALPYAAIALIYLIPRYLVLGEMMWKNPQSPDRPLSYTVFTLPSVICRYIGHLIWPVGLSVTYDTHFVTTASSPEFWLPAGGLLLASIALLIIRERISKKVWHGLLLIFVPLLPVLTLGQVSQEEYLVFDHYLYLSVVGLGYLIITGIFQIGRLIEKKTGKDAIAVESPSLITAVVAVLVVVATFGTMRENRLWADSYTLWSNVTQARPLYWKAYYNVGLALLKTNRFDEARAVLDRATTLKPDEPAPIDALGRAQDGLGQTSNAIASFKRAIETDPEMFESYSHLGQVYFKGGQYALAEKNFAAALKIRPGASAARYNLGLCYGREGRYVDASIELERVVEELPGDADAFFQLGLVYEQMGRSTDAIRTFQQAEALSRSQELTNKIGEGLARVRKK